MSRGYRHGRNGVYGFGRGDATSERITREPLVHVGRAGRTVRVDSYAQAKLEDAARLSRSATPLVPARAGYAVGDVIRYRGRFWEVGRTCFRCHASGWTLLRPVRMVDDDGPLPAPVSRECTHGR